MGVSEDVTENCHVKSDFLSFVPVYAGKIKKVLKGELKMSRFFALLYRMKYILRWALMRNTQPENLAEHSYYTATLAHALAVIRRDVFHGSADPERVAVCALYHDTSEILTGDLPTPIKYYNPEIREAYQSIERTASRKLVERLPAELKLEFSQVMGEQSEEIRVLVKAADKLSAYLKCLEEKGAGNPEFARAEEQTLKALQAMHLPEVDYFLEQFVPAFSLTLDDLD